MNKYAPLPPDAIPQVIPAANTSTPTPIMPVPQDAPPMTLIVPGFGPPARSYSYFDLDGRLLGRALRFERRGPDGTREKSYRTAVFVEKADGRRGWTLQGFPVPRPIYNQPDFLAKPDAPVLITEGEKAADASAMLFPDWVCTTSPNGAKSAVKANWSLLKGRDAIIAPDADEPGNDYMHEVVKQLRAAGAKSIRVLRPQDVKPDPEAGWDLADALEEGLTREELEAAIRAYEDPAAAVPAAAEATVVKAAVGEAAGQVVEEEDSRASWPFETDADGLWYLERKTNAKSGATTERRIWICSPLEVVAYTRSYGADGWGRFVRLKDGDGTWKTVILPATLLADRGVALVETLLRLGLVLDKTKVDALQHYLMRYPTAVRARMVESAGWHADVFVLPDATYGAKDGTEQVILQTATPVTSVYQCGGSFEEWKETIGVFARGNSRAILALCTAFLGPLLQPLGLESGGIHIMGNSSRGKSMLLNTAASVWGHGGDARTAGSFAVTWQTTLNGIEGICLSRSDTFVALDEAGLAAAEDMGQACYKIASGQSKSRAERRGGQVPLQYWRASVLSTGEMSLSARTTESGREAREGQKVRIVDVPADPGAGMGVFEDIHGHASPVAFWEALRDAASTHYGHASRAYLTQLAADLEGSLALVRGWMGEFRAAHRPAGADGQVERVLQRLAVTAAAGELATRFGVLPWAPGEASAGMAQCLRDWLKARGGTGAGEEKGALGRVRRFLEAHGASRFESLGLEGTEPRFEPRIPNRVGFVRRLENGSLEYLILPEAWKAEVCGSYEPGDVANLLARLGVLKTDREGRKAIKVRLPKALGLPETTRVYVISSRIHGELGDGLGSPAPEPAP